MRTNHRVIYVAALVGAFGALGVPAPSLADDPPTDIGSRSDPLSLAVVFRVTASGTGLGRINGVRCRPQCDITLGPNETSILDATPDPGSRFVRWDGPPCRTERRCTLRYDQPETTVVAVFATNPTIILTPRPQDPRPQDPKPQIPKPQDPKPQDPKHDARQNDARQKDKRRAQNCRPVHNRSAHNRRAHNRRAHNCTARNRRTHTRVTANNPNRYRQLPRSPLAFSARMRHSHGSFAAPTHDAADLVLLRARCVEPFH